ncbi:von Willebrand factor A [Marichromatium purpuratum 984]|uniref:von Willebrand factor A n=1 Tax=Marichromatium purpuratum 984 TaxID=765910 RepID=W0E4J1_MARPU|nr:VWA domain-containing protein [Marichromatium purpuratum]AHF04129.1 von Willebrand factor A [Marichromatium purpuratum 984]
MISLAWPWALLALPLPLLARRLPPARRAPGAALRLPPTLLPEGLAGTASGGARPWRWLALLAWVLLVLASARPQWVGDPLGVPRSGRDLMLAVDISGSMEEPDYLLAGRRVSRLAVVQQLAGDFVRRREGDRLGLILFGSRAYLQTPLTFDRATVATLLAESVVGLAGRETAIGDAIALAVKRLREAPAGERVLILLTDGENTAGHIAPLEAAALAAEAGVRVHVIGIGGGADGRLGGLGLRLLRQGRGFDPETLEAIAARTGGRFFSAGASEALEAVYDEIDRIEPEAREARALRPRVELYPWPAGGALLLALLIAAARLGAWRTEDG